ncbi:MAG: hypothetical protein JWO82_3330 [Akkermansiaceae bacterium]|nr:hypothetical protein [Akkermansiaceae bacterium]
MYFLAMISHEELAGIVSFSGPSTPIGRVRFGGHLQGVGGTGFSHFRTYGMYALVLLAGRGAGRFRDQRGNDRRVGAGDLIVVFPDVPHQYGPEAGDVWEEIFIAFDGAAFEGWRAHGLDPALPVWPVEPLEGWARRFSAILTQPVTTRPEACAAAGAVHLLIAEALAARPPDTSTHDWLDAARQALSRGAGAPTLPEIATRAGLGYETFRKTFKAATGESPARYRRRMRLAQAMLMLQRADLSLEMIARALDFCDAFHLSKAFKAQYGHSPAAARQPAGGTGPV